MVVEEFVSSNEHMRNSENNGVFVMYCLYIPKYKDDVAEFLISEVVKCYIENWSSKNHLGLLCSPGYLSTTKENLKSFIKEIEKSFKDKGYLGFFYGMNGNQKIDNSTVGKICNQIIDASGNLRRFLFDEDKKADHRKMIFFLEVSKSCWDENFKLEKDNVFDKMKVKAILIGSSNQSYLTYYGNKNNRAVKGEADVLLFYTNEDFKNAIEAKIKQNKDKLILFKSEMILNKEEYLDNILKDFLKHNLK